MRYAGRLLSGVVPQRHIPLPVGKAPLHSFLPLTAQFIVFLQLLLSENPGKPLPGFFLQGFHLWSDLLKSRLHDLPALFPLLL